MHSVMGIGATSVYMVLMLARTVYATHQGGINHLHTFSTANILLVRTKAA